MAYTPITAAILRGIRRRQGRPLRENAADIGIHRDREPETPPPCWRCRQPKFSTDTPCVNCGANP